MALPSSAQYEFFRPLCTGWLGKIDSAISSRKAWREVADECNMFYSKSAAAMWDPKYERKFWRNVKSPKFRITINKAFELVAIFGPNLFWEVPHRTVTSKRPLEIPQEMFQQDPQAMQIFQMLQQQQQQEEASDKVVANLMQTWLNYTPREQPGGGLGQHSELAIIDALVKGRGTLWTRPYQFPSSGRTLTGSFREPPENLLTDPDFNTIDEAKWIALRHVDPHWSVERRFKLEKDSLKNKSSLESAWSYGETSNDGDVSAHRVAGLTNDLIVWYEIWSKTGPGARLTGMETIVKEHLEDVIGDFAYIAVSPNVPYPLNCPTEKLRAGLSDEKVKQAFSWPVPFWADDCWPCKVLDFYPDTNGAWPIPPLAPALGELKLLNFLVPWLAQRIWTGARDFWAVAGPHVEHYKKHLQEGEDQTLIPTPGSVDDVRKAVQVLQQPETRADVWRIIELVSEQFEKRTGMTDFAYGKNEGGTQNRTAEETMAKARAVGVRPEHMQKKVVRWQSELATLEAFVTRWFVTGDDVSPLLGPVGKYLWEQNIMATDVERVVRQMQYDIAAASIQRPNRDRDIGNYQTVMQQFVPVAQGYGQQTGNYEPYNALVRKWADLHNDDLDDAMLPQIEPDEAEQQAAQQQAQMEMQKLQAEMELKKLDLQGKTLDNQAKAALSQMKIQGEEQQLSVDAEKAHQGLVADQAQGLLDLMQDRSAFRQEITQSAQTHEQKMEQMKKEGQLKLTLARRASATGSNGSNGKRQ